MVETSTQPSHKIETFIQVFLSAAFTATLAVYAYLGTFSRHLADDYCVSDLIRGNFLLNLWSNYLTVSDRFSNFIFIAGTELISPNSIALLPAVMLIAWIAGLAWLMYEASVLVGDRWPMPLVGVLSLSLVFFAILQAPNLFQTLYWRASIAAHLVPLVSIPFLYSFLTRSIRRAAEQSNRFWVFILLFIFSFLVGDFSEPTDAVMIVMIGIAILSARVWDKGNGRRQTLQVLGWTLAGAFFAMLVMAVSPANAFRLGTPPPPLIILINRSLSYSFEFILESVKARPLPTFVSMIIPLLIFHARSQRLPVLGRNQKYLMILMLLLIPILAFILIVASFSPSVYGQGYPLERARFSGTFLYVVACSFEGGLLGVLLAQWRGRFIQFSSLQWISVALLGITALYPLRNGWLTLSKVTEYRDRASAWDQREQYIQELKTQGLTDLLIPQLDGVYGIKELDVNTTHWANRCAAIYYNVSTIRAIPPNGP